MDRWIAKIKDRPNLPEKELLNQLWDSAETQPKTAMPNINVQGNEASINCSTAGASIGYKVITDGNDPENWSVYNGPLSVQPGDDIKVQAHRIGFIPGEIIKKRYS